CRRAWSCPVRADRRAARGPRTRGGAWPPRRRRAGSPPSAPGPRTRRTSAGGAGARTAPPRAPPPGSGSGLRPPPRSRLLPAIDLVKQLLGRRDRGSAPQRVGDELRGLGRAVAELLDGDELLEELLVEVRREPDQRGAGLIACRVVVDDQLELARLVAAPRRDVLELRNRDRRQEHLVADAATLEHDPVLELLPHDSRQHGDHASRPPSRDSPVSARASASATCEGVGSRSSPRSRPTERWT